jgi:hypothetical protein
VGVRTLRLSDQSHRLTDPVIIGATGGSGTRVFAQILRQAGLYIGTKLNESEDAVEFGDFSDRYINAHVGALESAALVETLHAEMLNTLRPLVEHHLGAANPGFRQWGWKEPRSIFLLPFWSKAFPRFRFVHVVRDGRDMAFSGNQNQLRKHGDAVLNQASSELSEPERSIRLWTSMNMTAAEFGKRRLEERYLRLRFEDLCFAPVVTITRLLAFLQIEADPSELAAALVRVPETVGQWRRAPAELRGQLELYAADALRRFGYLT